MEFIFELRVTRKMNKLNVTH